MSPLLAHEYRLCLRNRRAYVERKSDRQPLAALTAAEAVCLGLMDGRRTWAMLGEILEGAVGPRGRAVAESAQKRLRLLFADGSGVPVSFDLESLAAVRPPDPREGLRPLPGPRVLHWWVTSHCPRRCVYCFARPIHSQAAPDAVLPRARLQEIFREAATLGAENLLVAGAEPLLRTDLPEVMGDAIEAGLTPLLTTKFPISVELAKRFAAARVPHISLSVDSLDPAVSQTLIGSRSYPAQVRHSVANLKRAGVAFSFQSVVTRLNPDSSYALAAFAADSGAQVLELVPFEPVRWPITAWRNEDLALDKASKALQGLAVDLDRRYPNLKVQCFSPSGEGYHCDIGMTKLFFLPDGVVHRCYKLTHDARLRGRDLRECSLAAAWHDPGFYETISPPRENYRAAPCFACGRFTDCHRSGRCIFEAFVTESRYTSRDRACSGPYPASVQ